jgi:3-oxoacyl-[acyl-carrier-protein] synthase II
MTPLLHAVLDRFGALAQPEADGAERARPFDRGRSGGAAAEGATALLVEPATAAAARGCRPLVRLLQVIRGFDPSAPPWSWGGGDAALAATLGAGLARAGADPSEIAGVVSGASGARPGDRLEAGVLGRLFGERMPPNHPPPGAVGEAGGGHLGAAVLAAAGRLAAPTHGFAKPDPELGIVPASAAVVPPPGRVLVSSLASGGAAAWALLAAPD